MTSHSLAGASWSMVGSRPPAGMGWALTTWRRVATSLSNDRRSCLEPSSACSASADATTDPAVAGRDPPDPNAATQASGD
jgi:hypothetical protein